MDDFVFLYLAVCCIKYPLVLEVEKGGKVNPAKVNPAKSKATPPAAPAAAAQPLVERFDIEPSSYFSAK